MNKQSAKPLTPQHLETRKLKSSSLNSVHVSSFSTPHAETRELFQLSSQFIQPKLYVHPPNDKYEQEAEKVANHITQDFDGKHIPTISKIPHHAAQKAGQSNNHIAPPSTFNKGIGQGAPLSDSTKYYFESKLNTDLSNVLIHQDSAAVAAARQLNAQAFTLKNHIVFDQGKYRPETDDGKRLLAHELTHVVQQSHTPAIQRQVASSAGLPMFTEELLEMNMPAISGNIQRQENGPDTSITATPPARKDLVYFMGKNDTFQTVAKAFFKEHHPNVQQVELKHDNHLAGLFSHLNANVSATNPAGNIYIVSHANQDGTLSFKLNSKDKTNNTTFGELSNAIRNNAAMFTISGGVDEQTKVHIKGCNIGRNEDMLNAIDEAFGGKVDVDAPTHKQGYNVQTTGKGKEKIKISTEFFNTYNVEFPGNVTKSEGDLVEEFSGKYTDLGFSQQDWEIAVLGVTKHKQKVNKEAKAEKKAIDDQLKIDINALDKKSASFKDDKKALNESAKLAKADIDTATKEKLKTQVATKSKGSIRKVIKPFSTGIFNAKDAPTSEKDILKKAKGWLKNESDFKAKSASYKLTKVGEEDVIQYQINGETKSSGASIYYTYNLPYPQTDDAAIALAEQSLIDFQEKEKEFAVSRKEEHAWRIERKKGKTFETIKAHLEMTLYAIDLDFKEISGAKLDPATKAGEEFYYGESDFD